MPLLQPTVHRTILGSLPLEIILAKVIDVDANLLPVGLAKTFFARVKTNNKTIVNIMFFSSKYGVHNMWKGDKIFVNEL